MIHPLNLLYPRRCPLCGEVIALRKDICPCVKQELQRLPVETCEGCGAPPESCTCDAPTTRRLRHVTAPFVYSGLVRAQLLMLKLAGEKKRALPLGTRMAHHFLQRFPQADIDVVTFVPMTKKARRERGYNQSELLAREVGRQLNLPVRPLLVKTKETAHQRSLNGEQRLTNLRGAYTVLSGSDLFEKTVLLCDDIKTTGSTLWECETTLTAAGAKDVFCLCCAVTEYNTNDPVF